MFLSKRINEHCLIWNDSYSDYVEIKQVPALINFFYEDNRQKQNKQNKQEWEERYTEDGNAYYQNLKNDQIVWTRPDAMSQISDIDNNNMKIMINNQSIQKINNGVAVPKMHKMKLSKKELFELSEFEEKHGDVRWIPHSKDGFVIAQFLKRDGKYSIYAPFDDSDLFQIDHN